MEAAEEAVKEMNNPYNELDQPELEQQLSQVTNEWAEYNRKQAELTRWGDTISEHRCWILRALGVGVIPRAEPDMDDPLASQLTNVIDWPRR